MEVDLVQLTVALTPVLLAIIGGLFKGRVDLDKTLEAAEDAVPAALEAFEQNDGDMDAAIAVGMGIVRTIRRGNAERELSRKMERKARMRIMAKVKAGLAAKRAADAAR